MKKNTNYDRTFARNDYASLEIEIKEDMEGKYEKTFKKKRRNYANSNYTAIRT